MLGAAQHAALFLAIASRSYAERKWTKLELEAFIGATGNTHRLFAAECLPLDGTRYPPPLDQHNRMPLYRSDPPHTDTSIRIPLLPSDAIFQQRIHNLAEQMQRQLRTLRIDAAKPLNSVRDNIKALPGRETIRLVFAMSCSPRSPKISMSNVNWFAPTLSSRVFR